MRPLTWTDRATSFPLAPCNILGIDPSLTSSGLCHLYDGRVSTGRLVPSRKGVERLEEFDVALAALATLPSLAVVEGYSFGSRDSHSHALGELGGLIRLKLYKANVPYLIVPPTKLKKFVSGKGQVEKPVIMKELFKRWGIDLDQNDEADGTALGLFGAYYLGLPGLPGLTAEQKEALKVGVAKGAEFVPSRIQARVRVRAAA